MSAKALFLVAACLAAAVVSTSAEDYPKQFPATLGLNRFEQPFKINNAFNNPHPQWYWHAFAVCGYGPWLEQKFEDAVDDALKKSNDVKTWEEFLITDDATEEDFALELPTCLHGEELNDMGYEVSVRVFLVYGVDHQMLKVAKELRKSDIRQQVTPGREINVRKQIRSKMYDNNLKFMASGHGITHDGPSIAPRLLRYLFHDALDYNNIVMYNGTHTAFPEDFEGNFMSDNRLTSRNAQTGMTFKNMQVAPKKRVKVGGIDGCSLDPMEMMLSEDMVDQVRQESSIKFFNMKSPVPNADQNIGLEIIHDQAYGGVLSTVKEGHLIMSEPDMLILATALGLEQFFMSPKLPTSYGRRDRWGLNNCEFGDGFDAHLQTSIVNSWSPKATKYNFNVFKHIGFGNKKLVAALMGSHSVGQVQPCNTGDSGFGNAFCQAEALYLASQGIKVNIYKPNYDDDPSVPSPGSFFDETPGIMDNDYFKLLKDANADRLKNNANANPSGYMDCGTKTTLQCQLDTCARTFDGEDEKFVVFPNVTGYAYGFTKRVALTASEIVMMDNKKYKKNVKAMAKNNDKFRSSFVDAWDVLINIGHWEEELSTTEPDPCTIDTSGDQPTFVCGTHTNIPDIDDISMISSDLSMCILLSKDMKVSTTTSVDEIVNAAPCQLTGAFGSSLAILTCNGFTNQILACPV